MEKVVKALFLTLVVLGAATAANADFTTTVYKPVTTSPFGMSYENYVGSPASISWTFDWTSDLAALAAKGTPSVTSASLVVTGNGIADDAKHIVYLNGTKVGQIKAGTGDTTFNLLPTFLADLDGSVNMKIDLFVDSRYPDIGYRIDKFDSSSLTLKYFVDEPDLPPPPAAVPAPAAIILGSLGTGLVGLLRRRGTV